MPLLTDMFDASWYLQANPDVREARIDPLEHFMTAGWREGRNPSPAFDTEYYLRSNPDVFEADLNPLEHFIASGWAEGRKPLPETPREIDAQLLDGDTLKAFFDETYYRGQYAGSVKSWQDAFTHFMTEGWRRGCNPSSVFDTKFYLDSNPEVRDAGINPLEHYVSVGRFEGRASLPGLLDLQDVQEALNEPSHDALTRSMEVVADDFDPEFYRRHNPDLTGSDAELFHHFMTAGWREQRDPSARFDVSYYLWANPDVAAADINPLLHYRLHATTEIRRSLQPHADERMVLRHCQAVQNRDPFWQLPKHERAVDGWYLASFLKEKHGSADRSAGLIVSISHDDYRKVPGGIQNCIRDEEGAFSAQGWSYLHLFPARAISTLAPFHRGEFVASLNGRYIGRVTIDTLLKVLAKQHAHYSQRYLIIHHLMGVVPECIPAIVQEMQAEKTLFWLHDFFSICPSYALMRNDIAFCNAPAATAPACGICAYGEERLSHQPRIKALFSAVQPEVIAPSRHTLSYWQSKSDLPFKSVSVQEHAFISDRKPLGREVSQTLKIGFIGTPVFHKGWNIYRKLADRFLGDERYEFFYLGSTKQDAVNVTSVLATVTQDDRDAMQTCIRQSGLDVIVNWSLYPETFCFTAYEAIAAGAFLLAPKGSGNVESLLKSTKEKIGHLVADEQELISLLETDKLRSLVKKSERSTGSLVIRPCTFAYLVPEQAQ